LGASDGKNFMSLSAKLKMHKLVISVLSFLMLVIVTSCVNGVSEDKGVKLVTAEEMSAILELEDVQLVDVRTPKEHDSLRIENSQNIDFNSPTFESDITKLDKTKPVMLYCKTGRRSAKCAEKLIDAGFEKVYELEGGISKWKHTEVLKIQEKS
jgi:rhodanese-related sulfurtransferase